MIQLFIQRLGQRFPILRALSPIVSSAMSGREA